MLYLANEDYKLKCYDSTKQEVSLSELTAACFTITKSDKMKINNKSVITKIVIAATTVTGSITTSLIDGTTVIFVSASGTLTGNTQHNKIDSLPICMADENATIHTLESSKCTKGKLTVVGSNTTTTPPTPVTDICDIWFSDAGQTNTKGD
jgi:hypothetical protein